MNDFLDMARQSACAVLAVDADRRVAFWNRSCADLTGISAADAVGKSCFELLRGRKPNGDLLCGVDCPVCQMARGGLPMRNLAMRVQARDGSNIQLNVGTMLMPSPDAASWMVVHFMRRGRGSGVNRVGATEQSRSPGEGIANATRNEASSDAVCLLTERELEILRLLDRGLTTQVLSESLHISKTTVRNHVQRLLAKLNVHSRIEALNYARRRRLL